MTFYLLPATVVFSTALKVFLEDDSTPKTHFTSWVLLIATALLWPVTLPCMLPALRNYMSEG